MTLGRPVAADHFSVPFRTDSRPPASNRPVQPVDNRTEPTHYLPPRSPTTYGDSPTLRLFCTSTFLPQHRTPSSATQELPAHPSEPSTTSEAGHRPIDHLRCTFFDPWHLRRRIKLDNVLAARPRAHSHRSFTETSFEHKSDRSSHNLSRWRESASRESA